MNEEIHTESDAGPLCHIQFTRSSTKDAGVGYRIDVSAGCLETEADRVFTLAMKLKGKADEALKPKPLIEQLEESLAG
jgi:hypothetical protein